MFNDKVKVDDSFEFASVLKALGRVRGALFIHKYLKCNKKNKHQGKIPICLKSWFYWEQNPGYSLGFVWFSQIVSLSCKLNLQEPC